MNDWQRVRSMDGCRDAHRWEPGVRQGFVSSLCGQWAYYADLLYPAQPQDIRCPQCLAIRPAASNPRQEAA